MLKKIAHNTTIPSLAGNSDIRPLQDLIIAEKAVLGSLQKLSADFAKASESLRQWAAHEGDDLSDVLNASTTLLTHFSTALSQYSSHEQTIRDILKTVRTREEALEEMKRRRKSLLAKADSADKKLSRMSPEHKSLAAQTDILNKLNEDIKVIDREILAEEASLADFKRTAARSTLGVKFGGMLEVCEKGIVIGEIGKLVTSEIPTDTTRPGAPRSIYKGHATVESLTAEAKGRLEGVQFSAALSSPTSPTVPPDLGPMRLPETRDDGYGGNYAGSGPPQWSNIDPIPLAMPRPSFPGNSQGLDRGGYLDSMDASGPGRTDTDPYLRPGEYPQPPPQPTFVDRNVDEFGIPSTAGGGRFVTFPVRGNTRPSPLGPGPGAPPNRSLTLGLSNSGHGKSDSLSSTIAAALGRDSLFSSGHRTNTSEDSSYRQRRSIDGDTNPLAFVPPLKNLPDPWKDSDTNETLSHEEPQLAYTRDSPEPHQLSEQPVRHGESDQPSTRSGPAGYTNEEHEGDHWNVAGHENHGGEQTNPGLLTTTESEQPSRFADGTSAVPQFQSTAPVDNKEEERELNVAAAREISREMDAVQFNPPSPVASTHLTDTGRDTSQNRDVSPVQPFQPSPAYISAQRPSTVESAPQPRSPPSPSRLYSLSSVGGPAGPRSPDNPPSPRFNTSPPVLPPVNLSTSEAPTSFLSGVVGTNAPPAYRAPSEIPHDVGTAPPGLPSIKPSLPSSPAPLPGARTIAAAAFKRPQQRIMSGPGAIGGGGMDSGPGLARKPTLPSSPYPPRHRDDSAGNAGPVQPRMDDMGMQRVQSDSYARYHSQQQQQQQPQLQPQYQQSSPGNVGPASGYPQQQQQQQQQPQLQPQYQQSSPGNVGPASGYPQQQQQQQPQQPPFYGNVGPAVGYPQQQQQPPTQHQQPFYGNVGPAVGYPQQQPQLQPQHQSPYGNVGPAMGYPQQQPPPSSSYGNTASVGTGDEGQYDYIAAYMNSTGSVESADGAQHRGGAGYGDGRYATDLEGDLR